jgi:hypothetical protein
MATVVPMLDFMFTIGQALNRKLADEPILLKHIHTDA